MFIHNLEGDILDLNEQATKFFGVQISDRFDFNIKKYSHPSNDFSLAAKAWTKALNGEDVEFEWTSFIPNTKEYPKIKVKIKKVTYELEDYIVVIIKNIEEEVKRERERSIIVNRIKLQHEIDEAILKQTDKEHIFNLILDFLSENLKCDRASISLINQSELTFEIAKLISKDKTIVVPNEKRPLSDFRLTKEYFDGIVFCNNDFQKIRKPTVIEEALINEGIGSYASAPMIINSDLVGGVGLAFNEQNRIKEFDLRLLKELSTTLTVALAQIELNLKNAKQAERLAIIREIEHSIIFERSTTSIANAAAKSIKNFYSALSASISIFDENNKMIKVVALDGYYYNTSDVNINYSFDEFGLSNIGDVHKNYYIKDILLLDEKDSLNLQLLQLGVRSHFSSPLIAENRTIGVLHITSSSPNAFSKHDIESAGDIANTVAIALYQSQLRETIQSQNDQLENLVIDRTEELTKTNAELLSKKTLLQHITDNLPGAVFEYYIDKNDKYSIKYISQGAKHIFGKNANDIVGKGFDSINIYENDRESFIDSLLKSRKSKEQWRCEFRIYDDENNEKWIRALAMPNVTIDDTVIWTGTFTDISDIKLAQAETLRLNEELKNNVIRLEATNKELEAFSYSVSHDLRAPLRSMNGFSDVLIEEFSEKLDKTGIDYLNRIKNASSKMASLIDDLLKLSRLTRTEIQIANVDIAPICIEIVKDMRKINPSRIVDFICPDKLEIKADKALIRILLTNIIGNAWKFTSKKESALIEVGEKLADGERCVFVKDDGAGFDMEYSSKIFGAFQRMHSPKQFDGSGIGLAIVQRIINKHGATISAYSEVDKGAEFIMKFPE
jgi:signal transduction histidine kinase/GAF domain-containing protein